MLKVTDPAFPVASFSGLSDIHECSCGLQMATSSLDKQTTGCNLQNNWLMCLAMDLATLRDTYVKIQMAPMDAIWLFQC